MEAPQVSGVPPWGAFLFPLAPRLHSRVWHARAGGQTREDDSPLDHAEDPMAEIRIERKGRGLGWLWLLLALIIVAALAWYFLSSGRSAPAAGTPTTGAAEGSGVVPLALTGMMAGRFVVTRANYSGGRYGQEG
jgi:hypothetical protein